MIKRVLITGILTCLLVGTYHVVLKNYTRANNRALELNIEFQKIRSQEIKSVLVEIKSNSGSLLRDTTIVDEHFCSKLRELLIKLPDRSDAVSRVLASEKFQIEVTTSENEHINLEVYVTDITALILVKTKSKDWVEGLDDLYSSLLLKDLMEMLHPGRSL